MTVNARFDFGVETERLVAKPPLDHFFKTHESTTAEKENISRVNREEFLMRMFAATLWWNVSDCPFKNLQESLLHTFAGNIASDGWVFVLPADLVDFVDIDNSLLCPFDVAVSRLE